MILDPDPAPAYALLIHHGKAVAVSSSGLIRILLCAILFAGPASARALESPAAENLSVDPAIDTLHDDLSPFQDSSAGFDTMGDSETDYARDPFADVTPRVERLADPLKGLNRVIFKINGVALFVLLKPATTVYRVIVPTPARTGVRNFFHNLTEPVHFVSSILQGRPSDAGKSLGRFVINSMVGIGGLVDAAPASMKDVNRNFNQTLASWGIPPGFYLMLPLAGPSSVRDAISGFGESFLDPVNYIRGEDAAKIITGIHAEKTVNEYSFRLEEIDSLMKSTLDPYVAVKNYYEEKLPAMPTLETDSH